MPPFESTIWYLNIAATVALLIRLWLARLIQVYRWLFLYFATGVLQQCILLFFPKDSSRSGRAYGNVYMVGQAVKIVLLVLVVLELYRLALASQPALAKYGQKTAGMVLCAAAAIAALGWLFDPPPLPGRSVILYRFFSFERTMDTWVLIFLILICVFMTWFPVRMKRNVVFYLAGFMLHFFARSGYLLLLNILSIRHFETLNSIMLAVSFGCMIVWLYAFGTEGEKVTTVVGHRWDPDAMGRVSGQLESINASLLKLSRPVSEA